MAPRARWPLPCGDGSPPFPRRCAEVQAYAAAGKPVFMAEYGDTAVDFPAACAWGRPRGYSPILKDRALTRSLGTRP